MRINWALYAFIVIAILFVAYLAFSIIFYIIRSRTWKHVINQYNEALSNKPTINIAERVQATQDLFALIDTLIDYEIISDREYEILLNKKSSKIELEDSVSRIATNVFNNINPNTFMDINNVVTDKCLMSYIQKRTFVEYFSYIQQNNEGSQT